MKKISWKIAGVALCLSIVTGCAVEQHAVQFSPLAKNEHPSLSRLDQRIDFQLNTGYSRSLKSGSLWRDVGTVAQGEVFKPYQDVFTLEGSNVHEAYLVVANNTLTGFYLPVEGSFSPLSPKIPLTFSKQEQ
jgi:hypothetical protein